MIILGADHAGFLLKEKIKKSLSQKGYNIVDIGAFEENGDDDFSSYVKLIRKAFTKNKDAKIIAVCGSGVGMNIGLNKTTDIRCVVGHSVKEVLLARKHNDVNALALGGRTTSLFKAKKMINVFLFEETLGDKYKRRMDEIEIK